jgi:hypothetical protein
MSDHRFRPTKGNVTPRVPPATQAGAGSLAYVVGGLLVAVLALGYFALGLPDLRHDQARVPESRIDTTLQPPAPATPHQ